jgi:hypothetical protein
MLHQDGVQLGRIGWLGQDRDVFNAFQSLELIDVACEQDGGNVADDL